MCRREGVAVIIDPRDAAGEPSRFSAALCDLLSDRTRADAAKRLTVALAARARPRAVPAVPVANAPLPAADPTLDLPKIEGQPRG